MKKVFLLLLFISSVYGHAQSNNNIPKGQELKKMVLDDSVINKLQQLKDSVAASIQTIEPVQTQNYDWILQYQREQKAKQKKAAIIRIVIGIGLLVVLVIGLRRKGKK